MASQTKSARIVAGALLLASGPHVQRKAAGLAEGPPDGAKVRHMPPIVPTFTPLEWRQLAGACQAVAETERKRAAETGAGYFERSAELFERLAARCMEITRPG